MEVLMQDRSGRGGHVPIVVTRQLPDALMERLDQDWRPWVNPDERTLTADELIAAARGHAAEVLLVMAMDRLDATLVAGLPDSVRLIATLSVGHDHIDLDAARARGIAVALL